MTKEILIPNLATNISHQLRRVLQYLNSEELYNFGGANFTILVGSSLQFWRVKLYKFGSGLTMCLGSSTGIIA